MTDLTSYLSTNPALTTRDWKGKGYHAFAPFDRYHAEPDEEPWQKLDRAEVRRLATTTKARFLPRNFRMAAARDPGLIWDASTLAYRLHAAVSRASPEASSGHADREGGSKSSWWPSLQTGGGHERNCKPAFHGV